MTLPKLRDAQIAWVVQQVAAYIKQQRQTYRPKAVPLDRYQRSAMQPFFPMSVISATRHVVLAPERVSNPPFYAEMTRIGFELAALPNFAFMAAITFVDTLVIHGPFSERLLFHELVHVVQYEKLGLQEFSSKYVRGFLSGGSYEAIPLERNADELDGRFAAEPARPFSVGGEVQAWIERGKF